MMIKIPRGPVPLYSLVFVSLPAMEVHSFTANAGQWMKEVDFFIPRMNRRLTVAAWCVGSLEDRTSFINSFCREKNIPAAWMLLKV
jgi:hypothetical protein